MHVIVVGLSHKTAPVEIREKLAVPESRLREALSRLCSYPGVREGLLLSTCNRVEVYAEDRLRIKNRKMHNIK